jgi:long-chain fatty acid transport protein
VPLSFSGQAHFSNVPSEFATTFADQSVSTSIQLPDTVNLGVAVRPMESLRIGLDADYFAWQSFNQLAIQFNNPALDTTQRKNWRYEWNLHVGGEYAINKALKVRLGFIYDPSPAPASTVGPDLPDSTRMNFAAGVGYAWNHFQFDLGYQYVLFQGVTSTNPALQGKYTGSAQLIGVTVSYSLDMSSPKSPDSATPAAAPTPAPASTPTAAPAPAATPAADAQPAPAAAPAPASK